MKNIPIFCRECKQVDILPDYGAFHDFVTRKWDLIWQEMDDTHKEFVSSQKVVGYINIRNVTPKQLAHALKKQEYLEYVCRNCFFRVSVEWYRKNDYDVVTFGKVICNKPYYEKHKDEVMMLAQRIGRI